MSAGSSLRSEDQFLCSICLDLFTDPVSTPCGHNFCKTCISRHWSCKDLYDCPLCKEQFPSRPQIKVNTFIKEMVDQFKLEVADPGEVPCDVCTGTKLKALKSCLVCLASYCQTHLETHLTAPRLKKHQLVAPVENLEDRICSKHNKPLDLFCKTDQTCVCSICSVLDHKTHEFVPLTDEYERKKAEMRKTETNVQRMIQNRRMKIQEIKEFLKISKAAADREKAEGLQVFTDLMDSVERNKKSFMKEVEDKQKTTEKQGEDFIKDLEKEISELMKRSSEMKQLSRSEDHPRLLKHFNSLKAAPPIKNWLRVRVDPPSYEGTVVRAVAQLEEDLRMKMKKLREAELKRIQKFEVELTLDPKTAHPKLILSDDGKQVHRGDVRKKLPDNPERFTMYPVVLTTQSFSSGRFYFQVQVEGKTAWVLGVVKKSVNRKEVTPQWSPQNGFWIVWVTNVTKYYAAAANSGVPRTLFSSPKKVGVFVDYQKGLVSFYDADTAALIHSFTGCCFTEEVYPFFSPFHTDGGKNLSRLIICPVNQSA